jgi:signal transduction histidine kinase/CheY-like chemotaxis protein
MERAQAGGSLERVLRITLISSGVLGLLITAPGPLFFPYSSVEARAFLTMVHVGWMTAAMAVLGVFPAAYRLYLACSMLNIALGWWLSASALDAGLLTACLVLLFLVLTRFSVRIGKLLEESVNIRHEREQLVQRLQASLAETEAAHAARSRFLASASHDLLQPVHALLLLSSLVQDLPDGRRKQDVLAQLHTTAESIDSMFRGLLDLARYEAGTLAPQIAAMPVAHVVQSVRAAYEARCAAKGIALKVDAPGHLFVHADPAMFDRIVRNLVDNAVKFTPRGEIDVRCTSDGSQVHVDVHDTGVGIAASELDHVREAFYRGSSAREVEAEGVGLGLANGTQMARLMGGEIGITSTPGVGTRVRLSLPAAPSPRPAAHVARAPIALRYRCIALIEDDRQARLATETWLREHGATVASGADLDSVLDACDRASLRPDFVLADYQLGGGRTGVEAIRALRERFGALPAAVVSGETLTAADLPADVPLLPKPLRGEKLEQLLGHA